MQGTASDGDPILPMSRLSLQATLCQGALKKLSPTACVERGEENEEVSSFPAIKITPLRVMSVAHVAARLDLLLNICSIDHTTRPTYIFTHILLIYYLYITYILLIYYLFICST